jgi:hypothetical protein
MHSFDDPVASWIFDCGRNCFNAIAVQQLLKLLSHKFASVVEDNSGWPRVAAQPLTVKKNSDVVAGFVLNGY